MFWRFGGYANLSSLDSILDKPDVTLEEVLDENDTIGELKSNNAKLIDFLRDESVLQRLLQFVVAPTVTTSGRTEDETTNVEKTAGGFLVKAITKGRSKSRGSYDETDREKQEKQRRKYSYISCEILSSDVWSISESILDSTDQLRPFWEYIKAEHPLDNLQAGYFTKVNEALIEKQPARMVAFVRTLDDVVENMMKHVDCPMIMDLLLKLISLEKDPGGQGIVDWFQSQNLIPTLLAFINPRFPAATQTAAGDFLKAIITISANATGQDASVIGPNELTRQLVSEHCVQTLIGEMLKGGNALTVGVGIIIEVIRKNNSDYDSETQIGPEPKSSDPIYLGNLLRIFSHHIKDFMELILSPSHTIMTEKGSKVVQRKDMKVAWGSKIEPLGFDRFKTCELMAELLHCSNMGLLNEKGSEMEVKRRDAERERLKAEGTLISSQEQQSTTDFGTSVDSSGFHHAEAFTPLGESPEDVKRSDFQNNGEEDGFEKIALSEAMPESSSDDHVERQTEEGSHKSDEPNAEITDTDQHNMNDRLSGLTLADDSSKSKGESTTASESPNSKRRLSLLTEQIKATKSAALSKVSGSNSEGEMIDDKPAPLFAKRSIQTAPQKQSDPPSDETTVELSESPGNSETTTHETKSEVAHQELPSIQREDDGSPVLGDLLKIKFVEHRVVPTILDFFFRFPWNNFLHNVVYDVVQQVFNGAMDRGYNCYVAIDLFETGRITERVIEGQERSDKAQQEKGMRLGYMGHLTLIAEEIVKFTERQPPETLAQSILNKIHDPTWKTYVENTLTETRDRDNAILGGVRPDASVGPRQAVLNAVNAAQGNFGNGNSSALANAGLTASPGPGLDSMDLANANSGGFSLNNTSLLSGFGSSDEDDDDLEDGPSNEELSSEAQQQQNDDEDQSNDISTTSIFQNNTALPVPPSRARLQLEKRLADKKRQAEDPSSHDQVEPVLTEARTLTTSPKSSFSTSKPSSPTNTRRLRFDDEDPQGPSAPLGPPGEVETPNGSLPIGSSQRFASVIADLGTEDSSSDSENEDHEGQQSEQPKQPPLRGRAHDTDGKPKIDGQDESREPEPGLVRQTTRESLERIPLDLGDDSDEEGDAQRETANPLSALLPPTTQMEHEQAKKAEQEKLLAEWGLADDEEDDDDDDDEPVAIGTKYLSRRGSNR